MRKKLKPKDFIELIPAILLFPLFIASGMVDGIWGDILHWAFIIDGFVFFIIYWKEVNNNDL